MDEDLHPEVKELRSQLTLERQKSYTLEQKLKSLQRDLDSETNQLKLKLQAEQEKTMQLERFLESLENSDASRLQVENSILKSKVESLEKDYDQIKSRLLSDFSNKEMHIVNLAETNQLLEEELKSYQEISLSKNKQSSKKLSQYESTVKELSEKVQVLEEGLGKQKMQYEETIQSMKESLDYTQAQLTNKKKESVRQLEKLEYELETNEKLKERIESLEDKIKEIEIENEELLKDISNREKKIKSLSLEIHTFNDESIEANGEELENLTREVKILSASLKHAREQCNSLTNLKEKMQEKYESLKLEFNKRTENSDREKKNFIEQINSLKGKLEALEKEAIEKAEKIRNSKDEIIKELQTRIETLKQDRAELESSLQELQDQIQVARVSTSNEFSLNDELNQLRESYSSRCSTPRNMTLEFKKTEKLYNEVSEKELQIQILKAENASLKNQIENLVPNILNKLPEHQSLLAEKKRLETELVLAKECWGNENNNLRSLLEETEAIAINANLRYAEAATDRDLYYKMYLDGKKTQSKKSWFKKH